MIETKYLYSLGEPRMSYKYFKAFMGILVFVVYINTAKTFEIQPPEVPKLKDRVTDLDGILKPVEIENLRAKLQHLEQDTSAQVAVLIIPDLQGMAIEKYSLQVANAWKLGQKGLNNGVLLLFVMYNRKVRIEVGLGLESTLTNNVCKGIIGREIVPLFRQGKYYLGIDAAVNAIDQRLRKE
jgi:uncharacterized protein